MRKVLVRWRAGFAVGILTILTVTVPGSSAQTQSPAPVLNPINGHLYAAIAVSGGINWFDARVAAESQSFLGGQGHLVTITSAQEDNFIATNFPEAFPVIPSPRPAGCEDPTTMENTCGYPYWFGGFQPSAGTDEPEGDWEWVTGEPFVYTNWAVNEPNDFDGREEDCLDPHPDGSLWNDSQCDDRRIGGYIVEFDKPSRPVRGRPLLNPANRHFYEAVTVSEGINWFDAREAAESRAFRGGRGHLVTINSEQEDNFIATNFPEAVTRDDEAGLFPYWYGGFQTSGSPDEPEENWEWVTGEAFDDFTNWAVNEPNDFNDQEEDCLLPHGNPSEGDDWQWNDARCNETRPLGYVVEYDSRPGRP